ncbi:MAG: DUF3575 domain-containing protein [Bacteroidales bacterium]|jgi:hypothetical protein|nr:DUF3575 domain-containing protein [Bacteroidales bacterium]
MKKSVLFLIAVLIILTSGSKTFAQESAAEKDYKFNIKTNPLNALGGPLYFAWIVPLTSEYKLNFEARTFEKQSVQLSGAFLGSSPLITSLGDLDNDTSIVSRGFRVQFWYKFFLTDEIAPNGFYVGPHVSYASAKVMNSVIRDNYIAAGKFQAHVALGYQLITKGGFALDIFTGIGVKNKSYDFSNQGTDDFFEDFELKNKFTVSIPFGFSFGYAF